MNASNAKDYLPLVQALADGKMIQILAKTGRWIDLPEEVSFGEGSEKYRIKPEPKEIWVNRCDDGYEGITIYSSRESAAKGLRPGWTPVRYREVIE